MGRRISGGEAWARVAPSMNSTMEWMTDCGWTTTTISAGSMSNSRCASMSSSPLLIRVEELTVTTGPMAQVGWARACSAVTPVSSARLRPRKGPPEAVRMRRRTSVRPVRTGLVSPFSWTPERSAWAMAECSESTGTTCPGRTRARLTRAPPTTRDSLLARARVAPPARAARVGRSPTEPVMPLRTVSPGPTPAASTTSAAAAGPVRIRRTGSGRPRRSAASARWARRRGTASAPALTASSGTSWRTACSASSAGLEPPAARAATRGALTPSGRPAARRPTTSRVWTPMEPVEPSRTRRGSAEAGAGSGPVGAGSAGPAGTGLNGTGSAGGFDCVIVVAWAPRRRDSEGGGGRSAGRGLTRRTGGPRRRGPDSGRRWSPRRPCPAWPTRRSPSGPRRR